MNTWFSRSALDVTRTGVGPSKYLGVEEKSHVLYYEPSQTVHVFLHACAAFLFNHQPVNMSEPLPEVVDPF